MAGKQGGQGEGLGASIRGSQECDVRGTEGTSGRAGRRGSEGHTLALVLMTGPLAPPPPTPGSFLATRPDPAGPPCRTLTKQVFRTPDAPAGSLATMRHPQADTPTLPLPIRSLRPHCTLSRPPRPSRRRNGPRSRQRWRLREPSLLCVNGLTVKDVVPWTGRGSRAHA